MTDELERLRWQIDSEITHEGSHHGSATAVHFQQLIVDFEAAVRRDERATALRWAHGVTCSSLDGRICTAETCIIWAALEDAARAERDGGTE